MSHKVRSPICVHSRRAPQTSHTPDEYRAFLKRHHVSFEELHVLDQVGAQLFLRPYRASRLTGSLPRLKPGQGFPTASR
jgi:hypothetical protein